MRKAFSNRILRKSRQKKEKVLNNQAPTFEPVDLKNLKKELDYDQSVAQFSNKSIVIPMLPEYTRPKSTRALYLSAH